VISPEEGRAVVDFSPDTVTTECFDSPLSVGGEAGGYSTRCRVLSQIRGILEGRFGSSDGLPIWSNSQSAFKKLIDVPILVLSNIA
jgi:hypothetical protein